MEGVERILRLTPEKTLLSRVPSPTADGRAYALGLGSPAINAREKLTRYRWF